MIGQLTRTISDWAITGSVVVSKSALENHKISVIFIELSSSGALSKITLIPYLYE